MRPPAENERVGGGGGGIQEGGEHPTLNTSNQIEIREMYTFKTEEGEGGGLLVGGWEAGRQAGRKEGGG